MISFDPQGMNNALITHILKECGLCVHCAHDGARLVLRFGQGRLYIEDQDDTGAKPFRIDFETSRLHIRHKAANPGVEPIARAVGLKHIAIPTVLDATAGMGTDAYLLAVLGCRVALAERSVVMALLLEDAMAAALQNANSVASMHKMQLIKMDAMALLARMQGCFDVIYLDPMYPHRKKSALQKRAMRVLRALVGDDVDAEQLLLIAIQSARYRVVVKRPIHAPHLGERTPSFMIKGRSTRFDVYQK